MNLLTITDVAEVLGVSRQCARQYAGLDKRSHTGQFRASNGFPEPVATLGKREMPIYDAQEVAEWAKARKQ